MSRNRLADHTRRSLLRGAAGVTCAALLPRQVMASPDFKLIPKPAKVALVGEPHPDTAVWAYNELVPGPPIRVKQGDRLKMPVENQLAEETKVHFHGIRLPNVVAAVLAFATQCADQRRLPQHARGKIASLRSSNARSRT